jgi:hypothetical protein
VTTPVPIVVLATGRSGIGAAVLISPSILARGMGLDRDTADRTAWLARMFAVRDLALGIGVLAAVRRNSGGLSPRRGSGAELRSLVLLGVLSDAGDALAMLAALRTRGTRALPTAAALVTALTATAVGLAEARRQG